MSAAQTTEDSHKMGRSDAESARLDAQHVALIKILGFTAHERTKRALPENALIAELATGTGAFVRMLASELPETTKLEGFDISNSAFPATSKHSSKIKFGLLDAKRPPPQDLLGRYDAVFIRFMNVAMDPDDWAKVASTALTMLKPGGALQWCEGRFAQMGSPLYSTLSATTSHLSKGFNMLIDRVPHIDWIFPNMRNVLEQSGFEDISEVIASTDRLPEMRQETSRIWIGAVSSALPTILLAGDQFSEQVASSLDMLIEGMMDDVESGAYARYDVHVWTARSRGPSWIIFSVLVVTTAALLTELVVNTSLHC